MAIHSVRNLAVRMDAVTCKFGSITALQGVTCHIAPGTIFGLVGPNGAGKSTWLRGLLGLIKPDSGHITVGEWDPFDHPGTVRRQCSALLSPVGLYDHLTAQEHLEFVGRIWHMPRANMAPRMKEILEPWGLWSRRLESVSHWSQGMRQQLALAKVLFEPTPLLLLDEPTTSLDPDARRHAIRLLIDHRKHHQPTTIVTSHDLSLIEEFCDVIGILNHGELLAVASPDTLRNGLHNPQATVRIRQWTSVLLERLSAVESVLNVSCQGEVAAITVQERGLNSVLEMVLHDDASLVEVITAPSFDETVRRILRGLANL